MTPYTQLHLINRVLEAAPLVPFVTAWVRRRNIPDEFKPVYYYVIAETFFYFLDRLSRITIRNNVYIYHLGTVVLIYFFGKTYYRILPPGRIRNAIPHALIVFYVVAFLDATFLDRLFTALNIYSHSFACAFLVVLAMAHVSYLTSSTSLTPLEEQPTFFLSVAVLIYCSGSMVTYVAINTLYAVYLKEYGPVKVGRIDHILSIPDVFLFAVAMMVLARMFAFIPLSTPPRLALFNWLHYSRRHQRPFRLLYQRLTKHTD